ncbi:hypothetical protein QOS04_35370 [Cupriavidus sp. LEh21]|nr:MULTISPECIES: hypothetical protein [unclassified Cupriavidus]MDK2661824.1 hypothetical protein [Cupriavidus sp. LEh21]
MPATWCPGQGCAAQRRERRQAAQHSRAQEWHLAQDRPGDEAWAAVWVKTSYLHAQFLRIKARRGGKKAIQAVAAFMLTAAYRMLRDGVEYANLGCDYFNRHDVNKTIRRLLKRLANLGCQVDPMPHGVFNASY